MTLRFDRLRNYLRKFDFHRLFIEELGWDQYAAQVPVEVDGQGFTLEAVVEKRGVQIFLCSPNAAGKIPDRALRQKIDRKATEAAYEHLIIYQDAARSEQLWQWVAREPGKPTAYRESSYRPGDGGQSGEALSQKLSLVYFPLDDEEAIDLSGASKKLRDAFDRDGVTKKFYDRFKKEHGVFSTIAAKPDRTAGRQPLDLLHPEGTLNRTATIARGRAKNPGLPATTRLHQQR